MKTTFFRKAWIILVLACTVFMGCENDETLPIPEDKLVQVLSDVHVAEAALEEIPDTAKDSVAEIYYQTIFDIHGVEQARFDTTLARLMRDPERFKHIYQQVAASVAAKRTDRMENEANGEEE